MVVLSLKDGETAAMVTSSDGHQGCLRLLIASGVDLEQKSNVRR